MLKQIPGCAIWRAAVALIAASAMSLVVSGCGVKGPLVPPPKAEAEAGTPPPAPQPLIKDPAQPERRP